MTEQTENENAEVTLANDSGSVTDTSIDTTSSQSVPKKPRKRHLGDRKDGRLLHTIPAMLKFTPYIMRERCDACNLFSDALDVTQVDKYCRAKVREGKTNFTVLHVLLAAYVRIISQYPAANRFVNGQRIYARNTIEINMVVKKRMTLDSEDTCIKLRFEPTDTADIVYEKFNKVVESIQNAPDNDNKFDNVANKLAATPRGILRFVMAILRSLDYHGHLPKMLLDVSPFHGSMIITSMGSLGINTIYHHLYNFGNLPVFLAYGTKYNKLVMDEDGKIVKRKYIDIKATTDERICDGYYFATAFKYLRRLIADPSVLDNPPETVMEDVD